MKNRNRIILPMVIGLMALFISTPLAAKGLTVENYSFETYSAGFTGWTLYSGIWAQVNDAHHGTYGCNMTGTNSSTYMSVSIRQFIDVSASTTYHYSMWFKFLTVGPGANIEFFVRYLYQGALQGGIDWIDIVNTDPTTWTEIADDLTTPDPCDEIMVIIQGYRSSLDPVYRFVVDEVTITEVIPEFSSTSHIIPIALGIGGVIAIISLKKRKSKEAR